MYINYNDNELIFLLKDGSERAKSILFKKYSILISKMYKEGFYYKRYHYSDFLQEGLIILEKALISYNDDFEHSFYNYFKICFSRRLSRLNHQSDTVLCERGVKYQNPDSIYIYENNLISIIEKEFEDEDELTKKILQECIIDNCSLKSFCKQYNLNYPNTYYLYRKIRLKLEKMLTN